MRRVFPGLSFPDSTHGPHKREYQEELIPSLSHTLYIHPDDPYIMLRRSLASILFFPYSKGHRKES